MARLAASDKAALACSAALTGRNCKLEAAVARFDDFLLRRIDPRGAACVFRSGDSPGQFVEAGRQVFWANRRIAKLCAAPNDRALGGVEYCTAVARNPDDEDDGGLVAVGQQAGGALAQDLGIEADLLVGHVDRLAPCPCLDIDRVIIGHEAADIGDRIAKDEIASGLIDRESLVEVSRAGRIKRDEGDVCPVDMVDQRLLRRAAAAASTSAGKPPGNWNWVRIAARPCPSASARS